MHRLPGGDWRADWPDHERHDLGPARIAWLTWHLGFWWSMVLDHSFGEGRLAREEVTWPGTADQVRRWLGGLQEQWRGVLEGATDDDLRSVERTRWPFPVPGSARFPSYTGSDRASTLIASSSARRSRGYVV